MSLLGLLLFKAVHLKNSADKTFFLAFFNNIQK